MIDLRTPQTRIIVGELVQSPFQGVRRKRKISSMIDQEDPSAVSACSNNNDNHNNNENNRIIPENNASEVIIPLFGTNLIVVSYLFTNVMACIDHYFFLAIIFTGETEPASHVTAVSHIFTTCITTYKQYVSNKNAILQRR